MCAKLYNSANHLLTVPITSASSISDPYCGAGYPMDYMGITLSSTARTRRPDGPNTLEIIMVRLSTLKLDHDPFRLWGLCCKLCQNILFLRISRSLAMAHPRDFNSQWSNFMDVHQRYLTVDRDIVAHILLDRLHSFVRHFSQESSLPKVERNGGGAQGKAT